MQTPEGEMKSKSMLLLFTGDLPARAKVANAVQYNGYYGCGTCNTKGMYTGSSMSWPYDPAAELRTHKSIIELATEAFQTGKDSVSYVNQLCSNVIYVQVFEITVYMYNVLSFHACILLWN